MEKVDDVKGLCEKLVDSKMKVCPGISVEEYESYKEVIRYDQKKCTSPMTHSPALPQ